MPSQLGSQLVEVLFDVGGRRFTRRCDPGMTRAKIAISLPKEQLAKVHPAEQEKRESLQVLLRDLIEQYAEPGAEDIKWADRALAPRRRG